MFFVISINGLLLGWKKHTGGVILPKSYQGVSTDPRDWLPIHVLHDEAVATAHTRISPDLSLELERIDLRPDSGFRPYDCCRRSVRDNGAERSRESA